MAYDSIVAKQRGEDTDHDVRDVTVVHGFGLGTSAAK